MVQFITSNPTTAQINLNQDRAIREEEAANRLLEARAIREQRQTDDEYGRGLAGIMAEQRPSIVEQVAPAENEFSREYGVQTERPTTRVVQSPESYDEKLRRGITLASGMKGGGKHALGLATELQKRTDTAHAEAIKAFGAGDFELANTLNKQHGLGLDSVFSNPSAMKVTSALAASQKGFNLPAEQAIAYQEAGAQKFQEVFKATGDMSQAMNAAVTAGWTATKGAKKAKASDYLKTDQGYFNVETQEPLRDKAGKVVMTERSDADNKLTTEERNVNFLVKRKIAKDDTEAWNMLQTGKTKAGDSRIPDGQGGLYITNNHTGKISHLDNEGVVKVLYQGDGAPAQERIVRTPDGREIPLSQAWEDAKQLYQKGRKAESASPSNINPAPQPQRSAEQIQSEFNAIDLDKAPFHLFDEMKAKKTALAKELNAIRLR